MNTTVSNSAGGGPTKNWAFPTKWPRWGVAAAVKVAKVAVIVLPAGKVSIVAAVTEVDAVVTVAAVVEEAVAVVVIAAAEAGAATGGNSRRAGAAASRNAVP